MMKDEDIDRILSHSDEILPSSGFSVSVMDAVRREATAPPPIPFPWKRALPGVVAGVFALLLVLGASISAILRLMRESITPQLSMMPSPSGMSQLFHGGLESALIWTLLALLVAFVSVKVSARAV
jgi:hypothetical protein